MTFWKNPEFKKLQEWWYDRLKSSGFEDIEELIGNELMLKQTAQHPLRHDDEFSRETKEKYYTIIYQQVQTTVFRKETDRIILTNFAEGKKIKQISQELSAQGMPRARDTIRFVIRKYEQRWGLRYYTPKQLHKKEAS